MSNSYRIEFVPAAARELKRLAKKASARDLRSIIDAIDDLSVNPRPHGVEKLSGGDSLYRVRMGNFRIVYQIRDKVLTVCVAKVADRKEAYRGILDEAKQRIQAFHDAVTFR